jgi:hypothetical protein
MKLSYILAVCGLAALSTPALAQSVNDQGNIVLAQAGASLGACQPLTPENRDVCCSATNWTEFVRPEDAAYCPPATEGDTVRLGRDFPVETNNNDTKANTANPPGDEPTENNTNNGGSSNN